MHGVQGHLFAFWSALVDRPQRGPTGRFGRGSGFLPGNVGAVLGERLVAMRSYKCARGSKSRDEIL